MSHEEMMDVRIVNLVAFAGIVLPSSPLFSRHACTRRWSSTGIKKVDKLKVECFVVPYSRVLLVGYPQAE
jgi:hypothetical protein